MENVFIQMAEDVFDDMHQLLNVSLSLKLRRHINFSILVKNTLQDVAKQLCPLMTSQSGRGVQRFWDNSTCT